MAQITTPRTSIAPGIANINSPLHRLSAPADVLEDALAEADALAEPDALVLPEELDAELQPASKPAQSTAARAALINFVVFFMGAS